MDKIKCSAIIHTRNADKYLEEVISCLKDFDEIMVVDMESSDRTLEIAQREGCRIEKFPPCGFVEPARDFAMRQAKNEWVFFVDADEIVTQEMIMWLREFLKNPNDTKGVYVPRKNGFLNSWKRNDYPDYQLRLLNRDHSEWPAHIHSRPIVNGHTYAIPPSRKELALIHKAPALSEVMERMNRYTSFETERNRGKRITLLKLIIKPTFRFIKAYLLKGGFREGIAGYMSAKNDAIYKYFALCKAYEASLAAKAGDKPRGEEVEDKG